MNVLWLEFVLSLRRLGRRRVQNGLMLATFSVSLVLALLSWSLFHTIFLSQPDFDPKGEYLLLTSANAMIVDGNHSSGAELQAYKSAEGLFADFAEVSLYSSIMLRAPTGAERYLGALLSSRALQIVGAKPLLGRLFTSDDDKRGAPPVILLSQRLWENNFKSDPAIVGKTIDAFGDQVTVVGVLPRGFRFPNDQDLWFSFGDAPDYPRYQVQQALVKLKPGVSRQRAEQDLQMILAHLGPESPSNKYGRKVALRPVRELFLMPQLRISALILFSLALIFVMVSCANAANLMLIDFLGRRAEIATSLALGIPRRAAIRAVCFQVTVIAAVAALIAIALLPLLGPVLYDRIKIINAPYWLSYQFEWRYAGMAAALAALSAGITLVAPVLYLLWVDPEKVIRDHAYSSRGTGRALWRRVLLTGQIALLTVLGVSAGLLLRSSYQVGESRWGYPAQRIFMGKMTNFFIDDPPDKDYQAHRLAMHRRVIDNVLLRPDAVAAAFVDNPPGYSNGPYSQYALDPAAFSNKAERGEAFYSRMTEGYLETIEVPLVAGQNFPKEVSAEGPIPAIVNESLAQKLWPHEDPLQRSLFVRQSWMKETDLTLRLVICGVTRDFQANGPTAKTNDVIFTPFTNKYGAPGGVFLIVRDRAGVPDVRSLTEAAHRVDPRITVYFPSTIGGVIDLMLSSVRMTTDLTTVFAAAAVLLCAVGVYSLTVAQVLQSSRDFGIRLALGAQPRQLWVHFTRGHLWAALIGVTVGLIGATQVVRVLGSLLYGVDRYNLTTYASVAASIMIVAGLACIPSLYRLKRINPAECLRSL